MSSHRELLRAAIGSMTSGPKPLIPRMSLLAADDGGPSPTEPEIIELLSELSPNEQAHLELSSQVRSWDHQGAAVWAIETAPNTIERRHAISDQLAIYGALRDAVDSLVPPYLEPGPVVITAQQVEPWYTYESANSGFYWKEYLGYLKSAKGWFDTSALDRSTYAIVANVTNPAQAARYQAKGLVVGHVQSGKTANFTGVIARAADAGYRLVIVMTGTTNILRHQTQRRIDKELIGTEFVASDYDEDPDWGTFLSHGGLPSTLGSFDWLRLTGPRADYTLLGYGGPVLDFKRKDASKPFYDPVNLAAGPARIMVVKKHAGRLAKVARDLRPYQSALADVPVLVIDDESDQASLDTAKPNAAEAKKRTAVNRAILKLLGLLPRAQYVGYTATPFANVFVNPDDAEDLFPRDFIVALDRPDGYMGASDFHDLQGRPGAGMPSNEDDFVRSIRGFDEDASNLLRALDSFVLSGGIKLYRQSAAAGTFKHHTMLVHVSQSVDNHASMHALIQQTIDAAGYRSPAAVQRLRRLWEEDYRPVSARRAEFSEANSFEDLLPHIAECVDRVFSDGKAVLVVNGNKESDTPDFDRDAVWKVLVGGNKLSRGYTIEGLTVSYYRRRADAADTLMQMGRWFGYRAGYKDLVRLFIGREEPKPNGEVVDLLVAFEGACRDEIAFRDELRRYAGLPGEERIKPVQVPPLVQSHLLRPTAPNKMYGATLISSNFGGDYREPTVAPASLADADANIAALRQMLEGQKGQLARLGHVGGSSWRALTYVVTPAQMRQFLAAYRWLPDKKPLARDLSYLAGKEFDPKIDSWTIIAPQLASEGQNGTLTIGTCALTVKERSRDSTGGRYAVYSEPDHVLVAKYLAGHEGIAIEPIDDTRRYSAERTGVMLLYPVRWYGHETLTTAGFGLAYPENGQPPRLVWRAKSIDDPIGNTSLS